MNTHPTEEQLNGFADGTLEQSERPAVARHLEDCAACRAEVTGIRDLLAAAGGLPKSVEPERDLWPEIRGAVRRTGGQPGAIARVPARPYWALAAAAVILLVLGLQFMEISPSNSWRVQALAGTPTIGTAVLTGNGAMRVGDWLETDPVSRARIAVGRIGEVEVRPRSRVQLLDARPASHRIALARGAIHARVDAPPRLFIVETPAGTAIDLGCAYTLEMDSLGNGMIHVTGGWVEFARRERRSIVPLGFTALTRPDVGPGVPAASDAPDSLRRALFAFDFGEGGGGGGGGGAGRGPRRPARRPCGRRGLRVAPAVARGGIAPRRGVRAVERPRPPAGRSDPGSGAGARLGRHGTVLERDPPDRVAAGDLARGTGPGSEDGTESVSGTRTSFRIPA